MHSHVVEFLSVVFACFNVSSTLSIIVRRCLKSQKVKVKRKPFSNAQGSGNGIHLQLTNFRNDGKKIGVIKEQNLQSLFYVDVPK